MSAKAIRVLVQYRLEQADQALRVGRMALDGDYLRDAVNRFYYAMFYAVLALLANRRMETSKHQGAIALFDKEFVKAGVFSKDLSAWLHGAFEQRMEVDYKAPSPLTRAEVETLSKQAESFIQSIRSHLASVVTEPTTGDESR
jgi:uncharacterized protein (UPF0332 family)